MSKPKPSSMESLLPRMRWCSEPDPEELSSFTDLVKRKKKVALPDRSSLILDVTCRTEPPLCLRAGRWCQGGHPVLGGTWPLSIPPQAMDQGLFGDLSVQFVTLLSPCVEQYPNLTTKLTRIQLLVFGPSNVPVSSPSGFFQTLPAALDCQELGLERLSRSSSKGLQHSGATVYTVETENRDDSEQESSLSPVEQSLLLFFFLQHCDPFSSQLADVLASEVLIERHLDDILSNNRQAVTAALQTELSNTMKAQNNKKTNQKKLLSAADVIVSSTISIISCSTNLDFRTTCLNHMKVCNTRDLSASLRETLWRVTSWKFVPRSRCYTPQKEQHPECEEQTRREM
ncbi:type 2 DNA topoisomerase 6 subunit B-like [Salarias fasciatus]|uniref:type 2 DNA topoisomerase 6 subunit B-like n=1 Tax=Salarias fasciatus TaxID=181472 RepID=UPI00117667CD|nr:type 2 DNA topoisomerase 6 subunit B-like [Salarias fasciatus]